MRSLCITRGPLLQAAAWLELGLYISDPSMAECRSGTYCRCHTQQRSRAGPSTCGVSRTGLARHRKDSSTAEGVGRTREGREDDWVTMEWRSGGSPS